MKKFSLIFPTRERPELLAKLLMSIRNTTYALDDIEVLIAIDEDDPTEYYQNYSDWIKIFKVKRSLNFSRDYYNFLYKQSTGRWVIAINDDCVFETEGWDKIAYETLKDKSGVIYGWMEDGLGEFRAKGHGDYCCFPLQGREGIEALGYFFPESIPTWGADIWAKSLYDKVDSVVEIPIKLMHYNYHNFTREQDHISKRIQENQVSFDMRPSYTEVNKLLSVLRLQHARS